MFTFIKALLVAVAATLIMALPAQAGLARQVDSGGQLTGATGVDVAGVLYDVTFVDGTCSGVFSGCDATSKFAFHSLADANAASSALLSQVFLDVSLGFFDSDPSLTTGCSSTSLCGVLIPYDVFSNDGVLASVAVNDTGIDSVAGAQIRSYDDLLSFGEYSWAVWVPENSVPEPSSRALLGLAGVALAWSQRRRRFSNNGHTA